MDIYQLGKLRASYKIILITQIFIKASIKVCSQPESLAIYFTQIGCDMFNTGEYYYQVYPKNFSSGDYSFVYAADDNNVVGLLQSTPQIANTPEVQIPDEDVVDTMEGDILEAMEHDNSQICDEFDYSCGEEHEIGDEICSLYDSLGGGKR